MRTFRRNMLHVVLLSFVVIGFGALSTHAVPVVSIEPPILTTGVGSFFDVFVDISNVTDLYAFQFDVSFDPTIISVVDVTEGAFLPNGGSTFFIPGLIDNTAGTISFTADALIGAISGTSGSGTLAALNFQGLALGTSPVNLSNVIVLDSNFSDISFNTVGASVNVSSAAVPEPVSIILLDSGLVGCLAFGKRFRKPKV